MNTNAAAGDKRKIRASLKARRDALVYDPEVASQLNVQLAELCLANGCARIACYLPFGNEPDTELFIDWAIENNIEVLLPVSKPDGILEWVNYSGETIDGIFGFSEAAGDVVPFDKVDLLIIPALAIDKSGNRMGKGKGYYDRAMADIAELPPVVAVVFDDELVDGLPVEPHDRKVNAVVTPSQIVHFDDRLN
ncbi:MAG: 5-formyltetrahydrofolate cyclo-ligase [Rhodoluna sp.]